MQEKEKVKITEVGPRDGLQNESKFIPTEAKLEFIEKLIDAGLKNIEATSFVKPSAIPQLADSKELSTKLDFQDSKIQFSCLTPNLRGYEEAVACGYKEVAVFTAASNTFTKKNINKTVDESFAAFDEIFKQARKDGIAVRGYVSTVIACPYEGWIEPTAVHEVVSRLHDAGAYEISLGETIGWATPDKVDSLLSNLFRDFTPKQFAGHFHDTYGMAVANVQKSLEMGLLSFDSSAGGLGGCPYAKGASGNLATEDLVYLLENQGYITGVYLDKLIEASHSIEKILGRTLQSKTYIAKKANLNV
ncbi:hydroxymethylglutaryl-CoA lyase [Leptospira sp. GIMC2001]|uniref:hydroxymethylglutaryl-CoA lyase n=1 Tax=Leptospira sp. GIMC2001 TaxID=1513297 RepID=UPI002348FAD2|nr:hydroxymethylglutaryl-CoA lyase [Leptospira sp. GIMC2001]WCL51116.1 hydroxymethylglutaryl-CoA lyase [Leptospira sp. GIMC2001]